jgi:predicted glycoside hydrolase/deacetylase ChbG (UPF0249 family)
MILHSVHPRVRLIVNADDLGLCPAVNRGVLQAHRHGIVTSASLMVRRPAAAEAAALAGTEPCLSVGLHFDLGEWTWSQGAWQQTLRLADAGDEAAIEAELESQLRSFEMLMGRPPTHLDSHQHVHRSEPARSVLTRVACGRGIPLRDVAAGVRYRGDFYGQARPGESLPALVGVPALTAILAALPPGITELGCHPARGPVASSQYDVERSRETETLCDPRIRRRLDELNIERLSFHDLQAGAVAA